MKARAAGAVSEVRRARQQSRLVHLLAARNAVDGVQLHNVWHPQIVYDVHQQGAYASRMFVPPWMDPMDPNIDAILAQECNDDRHQRWRRI